MDDSPRQNLIATIQAAFATPVNPASSNGDAPAGTVGIDAEFQGKAWSEITPAHLLKHHEKLPLLSTTAYAFYLPAYLLGVVQHFDELDMDEVPARFIRSLAPPKDYTNRLTERVQHLTPQQKAAVYGFLTYYKTLFSDESWRYFPEDKQYLDAAIKFWGNAAQEQA